MNWEQVTSDRALAELPYKIELNSEGEIIMNAVDVDHSLYSWRIQQ